MNKKLTILVLYLLCAAEVAFSNPGKLKIVCKTTEAMDEKTVSFYYSLDFVNSEYFIKGMDLIDNQLNIKTGKTNIKLNLNKKWSLKSNTNMLVLEDTVSFKEKFIVHTIYLEALNGIFKSFSTNSDKKIQLEKADMSCAMLGSFPF